MLPLGFLGNQALFTSVLQQSLPGYSNVICTHANDTEFTFTTIPGQHILRGHITFGVLKGGHDFEFENELFKQHVVAFGDRLVLLAVGELWLFQQGRGPADEGDDRALFNYVTAKYLWEKMAHNLSEEMEY
ncbi:MAG: hypothetical protein JO033_17465 [Acidobacteriaceae bacterium]|nr:hypothetical protein [Acidobacteriaceae bacterium]